MARRAFLARVDFLPESDLGLWIDTLRLRRPRTGSDRYKKNGEGYFMSWQSVQSCLIVFPSVVL